MLLDEAQESMTAGQNFIDVAQYIFDACGIGHGLVTLDARLAPKPLNHCSP